MNNEIGLINNKINAHNDKQLKIPNIIDINALTISFLFFKTADEIQ